MIDFEKRVPTTSQIVIALAVPPLVIAAVVAIMWFAFVVQARAHEWYPPACCWSPATAPMGHRGDCDAIPTERVREGPDGYEVRLLPGDHPMVQAPFAFVVPYAKAKVSPDGLAHVCFAADMSTRCFFIWSSGS